MKSIMTQSILAKTILAKSTFRLAQRTLAAGAAILLLAGALAAQTSWKTYRYPADGISISMPSEPELSKSNVPTDAGSFELRAYLSEEGDSALYVGVCDYGQVAAGKDPNAILEGAKNGAIENVHARLLSSEKITLGIYPGMKFEGENDKFHFSARVYLVGTTLYQTLIAMPISQHYAGTQQFMDSFQLIARTH